jgi:hypothetical protein
MIGAGNGHTSQTLEHEQGPMTHVLGYENWGAAPTVGREENPTMRLRVRGDGFGGQTTGVGPLLFGLSLAMALPPAAMLFAPEPVLPVVQPLKGAMLDVSELGSILGSPMMEVGRGRVALGEVDRRLHRLIVSLEVFQAANGSGALVSIGVIRVDPAATTVFGATPLDLWALAGEPLAQHGVASECPVPIGDRSRMVAYGGVTTQIAWLSGERLMTASVTSLDGDAGWAVEAASAIALAVDRRRR